MSSDEKSGGAGVSRTLRHKERQRYLDDEGLTPTLDDADGGEGPGFSLEEKLASDAYNADLVKVIKTNELNLKYLQKNGFHTPLLFHNKEGLGLKVSWDLYVTAVCKTDTAFLFLLALLDTIDQFMN